MNWNPVRPCEFSYMQPPTYARTDRSQGTGQPRNYRSIHVWHSLIKTSRARNERGRGVTTWDPTIPVVITISQTHITVFTYYCVLRFQIHVVRKCRYTGMVHWFRRNRHRDSISPHFTLENAANATYSPKFMHIFVIHCESEKASIHESRMECPSWQCPNCPAYRMHTPNLECGNKSDLSLSSMRRGHRTLLISRWHRRENSNFVNGARKT